MRTNHTRMRVYTIFALMMGMQMVKGTTEIDGLVEQAEAISTTGEGRVIHHLHHSLSENSSTIQESNLQKSSSSSSLAFSLFSKFLIGLEHLVDDFFPIDYSEMHGGGGFNGDETTLAWGGSTIEVVKTQASYLTRPAAFGPRIVDENGLHGSLLPISEFYHRKSLTKEEEGTSDEDDDDQDINQENVHKSLMVDNYGCPYKGGPGWHDDDDDEQNGGLMEKSIISKPPSDWIALIERGGKCSFVAKVRVAQALGAMAVVVGDSPSKPNEHDGPLDNDPGLSNGLVTMYAPGDTKDVEIPSTFVTRPSYVDLIRLIDEQEQEEQDENERRKKECLADGKGEDCHSEQSGTQRKGLKVILWRDDVMWEWPLIDLAFVLLMLPSFMTLITIIVHRIRMVQQRRRERAPEIAVLNLPCLIWRGNGQPWEKVEDAQMVGEGGTGTSTMKDGRVMQSNQSIFARTSGHITAFFNRFRGGQTRQDMELGGGEEESNTQNDQTTSDNSSSDGVGEAGPSTLPANNNNNNTTTIIKPLKTVPVAPPAPPPDRTYYSCDECAICISDFVDGDLVRVLPCGHVFHLQEIDSWLTRVKKFCPICKRDITIIPPPAPPIPNIGNNNSISPTIGQENPLTTYNSTSPNPVDLQPNEEEENESGSLLVPVNRDV